MKAIFRRQWAAAVACVLIVFAFQHPVLASGRGQLGADHPDVLRGKWVLDLKQSSLGSDPYEQFDAWTLTFTTATTSTLAWTSEATIHGKMLTFSWEGPIDGSPRPLIGTEGSDAYRWHRNSLVRRSNLGHGETKRDIVTISHEGNTMIIQDRSKTPQGVALATLVLRREP